MLIYDVVIPTFPRSLISKIINYVSTLWYAATIGTIERGKTFLNTVSVHVSEIF